MSIAILDNKNLDFPSPENADEDGLLAIGGNLSVERLMAAYRLGIFPWYDSGEPLWWNPDPRFVLFPHKLIISHSMKPILRKGIFSFTNNKCFEQVMRACMQAPRPGQDGSWISEEVIQAYTLLHQMGIAHSFEAWQNNELMGGFYGLNRGKVFFGESMFSKKNNASKAVFIHSVLQMKEQGIELIDCQIHTSHLESLGAEMIDRKIFLGLLQNLIT